MRVRWETASRYYEAYLGRDLFDGWVLTLVHGGKNNRLGSLKTTHVEDEADGHRRIEDLDKRRVKRGYLRVSG